MAKEKNEKTKSKQTITEDLVEIQVGMMMLSAQIKALTRFLDDNPQAARNIAETMHETIEVVTACVDNKND